MSEPIDFVVVEIPAGIAHGREPGGWVTEQTGGLGDTLRAGSR